MNIMFVHVPLVRDEAKSTISPWSFLLRLDESAEGSLQEYQRLDIYAAYLVTHFEFGSNVYIAIATLHQNIVVLRVSIIGIS